MTKLKFISTALVSLGCIFAVASSSSAQSINRQDTDVFNSNEVDPLTGNSGFNPMDLIHNANLLNGRSSADFQEDSNKQLDSAASDFRKQQLQRMMELQQQQNSTPETNNQEINSTP